MRESERVEGGHRWRVPLAVVVVDVDVDVAVAVELKDPQVRFELA